MEIRRFHPSMITSKIRERMVAGLKAEIEALDLRNEENQEILYESFNFPGSDIPFYTSDGQFCGGIESEWYEKNGRIYKFLIENGVVIEATSENNIKGKQ